MAKINAKSAVLRRLRESGIPEAGIYPSVSNDDVSRDDSFWLETRVLFRPVTRVNPSTVFANRAQHYNLPAAVKQPVPASATTGGARVRVFDQAATLPSGLALVGRGRLVWAGSQKQYESRSAELGIWSREKRHVVVTHKGSVYVYRASGFLTARGALNNTGGQGNPMLILTPSMRSILAVSVLTNAQTFHDPAAGGSMDRNVQREYTLGLVSPQGYRFFVVRRDDALSASSEAATPTNDSEYPGIPVSRRVLQGNAQSVAAGGRINESLLARLMHRYRVQFERSISLGQGLTELYEPNGVNPNSGLSSNWYNSPGLLGLSDRGVFSVSPLPVGEDADTLVRFVIAGEGVLNPEDVDDLYVRGGPKIVFGMIGLLDEAQLPKQE